MIIRRAEEKDVKAITIIYNQGIMDRIATLEEDIKTEDYVREWLLDREPRYSVLVMEENNEVIGWTSVNAYNHRCSYRGVGEISIYIHREYRNQGIGSALLQELEEVARQYHFHKLVLFTFVSNKAGQGLYRKRGFREVGIFEKQGMIDGKYIDVMTMEKLLV